MKSTPSRLGLLAACLTVPFLVCIPACLSAQEKAPLTIKPNLPSKKLIEFGWDQNYGADPEYIRDNIAEIEKKPFDGMVFCLQDPVSGFDNGGRVFHIQGWNEEKIKPVLKTLGDIKWNKYTDNFLALFSASTMDWFSDSDWEVVTAHTKFMSLAARTAHCKGIMFDAEPYGESPWQYDKQKDFKTKSFEEYSVKVRQRGRQFMESLSSEMPAIKILTLFQYSLFAGYPEYPGHEPSPDPAQRLKDQIANPYGLMGAFFDGMLEAAGPDVEFIDGNEFAYFYKNPLEFYRSYQIMRQTAKLYVAPELRGKFDRQVKAGQSIYLDYLFNLRPDIQVTSPSIGMTQEQRERWLEHNAFYGLQTADEYVWLWSENWNWYTNKVKRGEQQSAAQTDSAVRALIAAKGKTARGEALGFDIADDIKTGDARRQGKLEANMLRRSAPIAQLAAKQKPVIDGKLNEPIYAKTASLEAFTTFYRADEVKVPIQAPTRSWVYFDDKNLYIAFRNYEPQLNAMKAIGTAHDNEVWKGDSVDISIRPNPQEPVVYHFILNPANIQWDSLDKSGNNDLSYNPKWKSAVQRGANEWTVEIAIPWAELKMAAPPKGSALQANLARQRMPELELTSWSQVMAGFMEPENFGTWTFQLKAARYKPTSPASECRNLSSPLGRKSWLASWNPRISAPGHSSNPDIAP